MRTLYHPDGNMDVWGIKCKFDTFNEDQVQSALKNGWFESPLDFNKPKTRKPRTKAVKNDN